jgi:nucleotidyltransferase/DNA polymerase involved in DNA repair
MIKIEQQGHVPMILHVDGDSFFVACEIARFPELVGKPVAVGAERGIITALNYEAKKLGVTRCMPVFQLQKEFPSVTILPAHFELYEKYSQNLCALLSERFSVVQKYSVDECFAVVHVSADQIHDESYLNKFLSDLKNEINSALGVTYSFGLGPTKSLAKAASKMNKPNGHAVIIEDLTVIRNLLKDIPIESVWGIGRKTSEKLRRLGVSTATDFIQTERSIIEREFTRPTVDLWHELNGEPRLSVPAERDDYKSMQSTQSFNATNDANFVLAEISRHSEIIGARMRAMDYVANSFSVFIKYGHHGKRLYKTASFIVSHQYTNDSSVIIKGAHRSLQSLIGKNTQYRACGITAHNIQLLSDTQNDLFGEQTKIQDRNTGSIIDEINKRFGSKTIMNASSMSSYTYRNKISTDRNASNRYEYGLPLPYLGEVS